MKNLEKYKAELEQLISDGEQLKFTMMLECSPDALKKYKAKNPNVVIKEQQKFSDNYQSWYSESLVVIKLLLPDRLDNFVKMYEKPKSRKELRYENYVIEDYLQELELTNRSSGELIVGPQAAIPKFKQQLNILKSAMRRFESSLFDIKSLLHADLFDSELEAALNLNKKGYGRGAGAMAAVVLEEHLLQVCEKHNINIGNKQDPSISELNDLLKKNDVIEIHDFRFIQRLTDIRNLCDHRKKEEPTKEQVKELIEGVQKIIKVIH